MTDPATYRSFFRELQLTKTADAISRALRRGDLHLSDLADRGLPVPSGWEKEIEGVDHELQKSKSMADKKKMMKRNDFLMNDRTPGTSHAHWSKFKDGDTTAVTGRYMRDIRGDLRERAGMNDPAAILAEADPAAAAAKARESKRTATARVGSKLRALSKNPYARGAAGVAAAGGALYGGKKLLDATMGKKEGG